MKLKKTNMLLGIIAINLTLLTFIQLDVWPVKANANSNEFALNSSINYGLVPMNEDGSINVNLNSSNSIIDVNLEQIRGEKCLKVSQDEHNGGGNAIAVMPCYKEYGAISAYPKK